MNAIRDDARKSAAALLLSVVIHAGLLVALSILGVIPAPDPVSEPFPLYLGPTGPAGGVGAAKGLGAPAPAGGADDSIHISEALPAPERPAPDTPKPAPESTSDPVDVVKKAKPKLPAPVARPAQPRPSAPTNPTASVGASEGSGGGASEGMGASNGKPGGTGLGGGGVGGTTAYEQILAAWLDRHKYYPSTLRRRGIEGEGKLQIRITRTGDVLDVKILQAFTHPSLTSIAEDWVKRAEPFPPVPSQISGESYVFAVPVVFRLE